jgi:septum formation topological specificity factor MinE
MTNNITTPISINSSDLSNNVIDKNVIDKNVIDKNVTNDDALLLQKQKNVQLKKARDEQIKKEVIQVVCRQTELTPEEARDRLEKVQYNYMKVLNEYFEIKNSKIETTNTINQKIYGEIRTLMDTGAKSFRMEQERAQYIQKMNEKHNETNPIK